MEERGKSPNLLQAQMWLFPAQVNNSTYRYVLQRKSVISAMRFVGQFIVHFCNANIVNGSYRRRNAQYKRSSSLCAFCLLY
jgi:hypothetical protein